MTTMSFSSSMAGSASLEENLYSQFGSFSQSADVSESESSSSFSYDRRAASSSLSSSPLFCPESSDNCDFLVPLPITLPVVGARHVIIPADKPDKPEVELMKERFAKLLLGEDISGGGKGICSALAISNAITNLSATVFGELRKLEPLAPQKKLIWCREMEWLLSVSDSIVELIPSIQEFSGGGTFEVMSPQLRFDLYVNLPTLKRFDAMLISLLDEFCDTEFYYVDHETIIAGTENIGRHSSSLSSGRPSTRLEEKWWLPIPKVPPNGMSDGMRKRLQKVRECANQIFKDAMAINSTILAHMEIPKVYLESLPKSGKDCIGELIYKYISSDQFFPECLLDYLDHSSEYTTLEMANRIEAALHIWRQKFLKRHADRVKPGKSLWGAKVKSLVAEAEKSKLLAERAETLLQNLKQRFTSLPHTTLDMNKIQHNKDVGHSILESHSRVLGSLAFNMIVRINDLLYIDDATKQRALLGSASVLDHDGFTGDLPVQMRILPSPFSVKPNLYSSLCSAPVFSSSKQKLESVMSTYSSVFESSPRDSLEGNLERLIF